MSESSKTMRAHAKAIRQGVVPQDEHQPRARRKLYARHWLVQRTWRYGQQAGGWFTMSRFDNKYEAEAYREKELRRWMFLPAGEQDAERQNVRVIHEP